MEVSLKYYFKLILANYENFTEYKNSYYYNNYNCNFTMNRCRFQTTPLMAGSNLNNGHNKSYYNNTKFLLVVDIMLQLSKDFKLLLTPNVDDGSEHIDRSNVNTKFPDIITIESTHETENFRSRIFLE